MSNTILNKELCLNAQILSLDTIIKRINKPKNACLKKLSLIHFKDKTIAAILSTLSHMKYNLRVLDICRSKISSDEAYCIAAFIAGSTLKKLLFTNTAIASSGSTAIIDSVAQSSIQKLIFYDTYIERDEARAIAKTLRKSFLTKLSLVDCTFESSSLELIIGAVRDSTLQILALADVTIRDEEIATLIDCVENSTLTKLFLHCTRFHPSVKMSTLVTAIQQSTLQCLDVRNTILFKEAKDIINIVECSPLVKFYFDQYSFSSETMVEIMRAIKCNNRLRNIYFAHATLTDQLLVTICDSLADLDELCLSECILSNEQLCTIINSIKSSSITSLHMSGIVRCDQTVVTICDLLENHDLRKINICGISHVQLHSMLPSITKSKLIKVVHNLSSNADDTLSQIEHITKEYRTALKNVRRIKSARCI